MKLAVSIILSEGYLRWNSLAGHLYVDPVIKDNEFYLYVMCFTAAIG